jgi:hypothetical protein
MSETPSTVKGKATNTQPIALPTSSATLSPSISSISGQSSISSNNLPKMAKSLNLKETADHESKQWGKQFGRDGRRKMTLSKGLEMNVKIIELNHDTNKCLRLCGLLQALRSAAASCAHESERVNAQAGVTMQVYQRTKIVPSAKDEQIFLTLPSDWKKNKSKAINQHFVYGRIVDVIDETSPENIAPTRAHKLTSLAQVRGGFVVVDVYTDTLVSGAPDERLFCPCTSTSGTSTSTCSSSSSSGTCNIVRTKIKFADLIGFFPCAVQAI